MVVFLSLVVLFINLKEIKSIDFFILSYIKDKNIFILDMLCILSTLYPLGSNLDTMTRKCFDFFKVGVE